MGRREGERRMDRYGMRSFWAMMLVSLSMLILLNQYAALGWSAGSSSSSSSAMSVGVGSKSSSLGMDDLHGEEMRRRLLQVTPAPAPAPAATGTGVYIGYGVLSAGYVPCPPQTGRSYYTSNCDSATGAVQPYSRGCSTITLCARG